MFTTKSVLFAILSMSISQLAVADEETRELDGFDAIAVSSGIDLLVRQGDSFHVEVHASTGDTDDVITEVSDDTLTIRKQRSTFSGLNWLGFGIGGYEAYVTLPELRSLSASGGSDVKGENTFCGDSLDIRISGGSDLSLEVAMDRLDVTASGGSDVSLEGTANEVNIKTSGGSDLSALELTAKVADLTASGGSDISIDVLDRLTANASGGSDIEYSGNPGEADIDESGGSDVDRR